MRLKIETKAKYSLIILFVLLTPTLFTFYSMNTMMLSDVNNLKADENLDNFDNRNTDGYTPKSSDIIYLDEEYSLSQWWDKRFRYRLAIELEELEGINRHEPVEVFLNFEDNEHYVDSARLVSFNATGNDEWSSEIPVQVWNDTKYPSGFIESCTITFLADVTASSNQTYFLYYNENLGGIGVPSYNTDFTSTLAGETKLTVTVGNLGDLYKTVFEVGKGATDLIKDSINFHTDDSLSPEKQLAHQNLRFLAHMDEGGGNYVNDSTGNVSPGQLVNTPTWVDGVVRDGLDFEQSSSEFVNFGASLEGPGDPFSDFSTEFTVTAWIKPEDISHTQRSNHYTYNCFLAKAGDPFNDNFEVGINTDGTIHVYLDTETRDAYANFGEIGDVNIGVWNFIAIRYDSGSVDVKINDNWYPSNVWSSATDLDQAEGSLFTIGSTDHYNTYFDGVVDEVAIYNISISNQEVEDYKYGSETSTIEAIRELENGEVFSRYEINWTESFDMHVSDVVSFYYDYNLWNINRTISFDNEFNGENTNSQIVALNTYYDFSGLTQSDEFYYFYDGDLLKGLANDGFTVENYTIIHDCIHSATKNTLGVFVADYYASGDAFSEIDYLKGAVSYESATDIVKYTPGLINNFKNNAEPNNKLHIEFWEFIDHINDTTYTPKLTENGMKQLFEDMYQVLKNPINIFVYNKDSKFYNLEVNITDIDDNLVPGAKISLWNATNPSMSWEQDTNENGVALFTRLNNGSFVVNASYEKYGKTPLTITSPQAIEINESNVDSTGLRKISFEQVQLTSLNLTLNRFNNSDDFQGPLEGAEVTFLLDDGSGQELIGSENADENGNVVFRWTNYSSPADGNVTFFIRWFAFPPSKVVANGDLDGQTITNTNVTFYFYIANSSIVNVTFGQTFESDLTLTVYPDPDFNQMLGDILNFQVNFTYTQNSTITLPVTGATLTYDIKFGTQTINTQTLYFVEIGGGLYNLTINTSNQVEPGGEDWLSDSDYLIEIYAIKPGFISDEVSTSFILDPKTSTLVGNETELAVYWGEYLIMDVTYTDVSFGSSNPIDGATIEYSIIGVPSIVGTLTPYGTDGRYKLEIDTTEFPTSDSYTLQIIASKQNYQEKSIFFDVTIFAIKSLINDSVGIYESLDLAFREEKLFYFEYIIESTGEGLADSSLKSYEWTKEIGGNIVDSGVGTLIDLGNGLYTLDFNTETKEIATYTIIINIEKENYVKRGGIIILNIIPRELTMLLPSDRFDKNIISSISGDTLTFDLELIDTINGSYIIGANVFITLQGQVLVFTEIGNGIYSISIAASILPEAFILPITISAQITVNYTNYYDTEILISVVVGMVEIFPGFPMFYFLIIVIGIVAIAGSLLAYRQIQRARIPTFVKKVKEMSKDIKGKKSISDSLLYPSKEEFIIKRLGDKWEMLGLSLEEILGIDTKKKKKLPESIEGKGGAF